jgi:hypothetical protein
VGAATIATITNTQCLNIFTSFLQQAGRPTITTINDGVGAIVASNLSGTNFDFMARGTASGGICRYGYTGQFADGTGGNTVPVIEYNANTGVFSLATEL